MLNIVVAFKDEARSLINLLSLRPQQPPVGSKTFPLYECGDARLIISGIGAGNAEAAARFLCERSGSNDAPIRAPIRWLNFGIAGSAQFDIGDVVVASRIRRQSCGEQWSCHRPPATGLPDALVRTVEQPETDYAQSGVYDMEAAGICRALSESRAGELCCIKLVTDGPGRPASRLKMKMVRAMLDSSRPQLSALLGALKKTG